MFSDWRDDPLSEEQLNYAEAAAKASIDIFKALVAKKFWFPNNANIREYCEPLFGKEFRSEWH